MTLTCFWERLDMDHKMLFVRMVKEVLTICNYSGLEIRNLMIYDNGGSWILKGKGS